MIPERFWALGRGVWSPSLQCSAINTSQPYIMRQFFLITHSFFSHNFSLYTVQRGLSNLDSPSPPPQSGLCLANANNSHHSSVNSANSWEGKCHYIYIHTPLYSISAIQIAWM